jgi:Leucine-rich repeat (LRR) protein
MASWTLKDLNNWTDLSIIPNVIELDISFNLLNKIPLKVFKLITLQKFKCNNIQLKNIPKEIGQLINLQIFNCFNNQLTNLPNEIGQLINLHEFNCYNNKLTYLPNEIGQLINLQIFICYDNKLINLPNKIGQLINLQIFDCSVNELTMLPKEIGQLINLQIFDCSNNQLTNLPNEIGQLINLHEFLCLDNQLTNLPNKIGQLINLQIFDCLNNELTNLPNEIGQLINLHEFHCSNNELTNLPNEIGQLINLEDFDYSNNPITYIPPNINRILNRIKNHQNIYSDQQNVHNHEIQNCIRQSINNIIQIKPSINNIKTFILENKLLNDKTKSLLFDYILNKDLFNNITFKELLLVVLTIIETKPNKNDIYEILNQEINDAECKCLTGRISRLINVLNGQDDRIVINISDKEQIGNIIVLIRNNLGNEYTVEKHKELVIKELKERGFNEEIINEYANYIE